MSGDDLTDDDLIAHETDEEMATMRSLGISRPRILEADWNPDDQDVDDYTQHSLADDYSREAEHDRERARLELEQALVAQAIETDHGSRIPFADQRYELDEMDDQERADQN